MVTDNIPTWVRWCLTAFALGVLLRVSGYSQQISPPSIEWQRVFGGSEREELPALQQTRDGGFVFGAISESPPGGGNKTAPNYGGADYWIVRLDAQGNALWEQSFGGYRPDYFSSLQETVDGGFIIGGGSWSTNDGNKTTEHFGSHSTADFWVLRLDSSGNRIWERNYGGTADDYLHKVEQTADGGFFLFGRSGSTVSGNKTAAPRGGYDYWVVRLDSNGQKLWEKVYGGTLHDLAWNAQLITDGGLVLVGGSISQPGGTKSSANYGDYDFWVVRLNANGSQLWERSFGGTGNDTAFCVKQTPAGGFVVAGRSASPPSGNKTSPLMDNWDFWVVWMDTNGNKVSEQSFGGTANEYPYSLDITRDGGVILGGWSSSPVSGTKTATNYGAADYWVVRLDADGNKLWEATYGGSRTDELHCLQQTRDGGFLLGGKSWSSDGTKPPPHYGFGDCWVIKLGPEQPRLQLSGRPFGPGGLRLLLTGIKNLTYAVEYSSDLNTWSTLQTNTMSSALLELSDPGMTNATQRFYRARLVE